MKIDVLVLEIGSTTTVVNAFNNIQMKEPIFIGQGFAPTTVHLGDVKIGIENAINDLKNNLAADSIDALEIFATSSAAGGLKMTVHGLVYDMTVKAAKEAALGAGANIHLITAGKLSSFDINKINNLKPNIILVAGGVDFGERQTALNNAYEIAKMQLNIPVIYAGNCENIDQVKDIFINYNQEDFLHITNNVYPKIDILNVEPSRNIIQEVFESHIIHAPGMHHVKEIVNQNIIPTPGAVMLAAKLLEEEIGDLIVFDVGGATTDLHSVTKGSDDVSKILISPEPYAKRTVEGDLGVYINRNNLIEMIGVDNLLRELQISLDEYQNIMNNYEPIPKGKQVCLVERLTKEAIDKALVRHCGKYRSLYGSKGKERVAEGKDLTNVKYLIGTGGALTRLPYRREILKDSLNKKDSTLLLPSSEATILIDEDYIMASLGVLSIKYPKQALKLLKQSLRI